MQRFMQEKNLLLFLRRLLAGQKEMDEERRQVIFKLLAEEEAKVEGNVQRVTRRFCAFDFSGCRGCEFPLHAIGTVSASKAPMKGRWRGQIIWFVGAVSHATFHAREDSFAFLKKTLG